MDRAALAVDADVFVVQAQVEVFDVDAAGFGGAGAADVGGLEQHPVAQPVERGVFAGPAGADDAEDLLHLVGVGRPRQGLGNGDGVDAVHRVRVQQFVPHGPPAERRDGGPLALAA
nr:hypothetical protein [Actinocrispum wychmicini]